MLAVVDKVETAGMCMVAFKQVFLRGHRKNKQKHGIPGHVDAHLRKLNAALSYQKMLLVRQTQFMWAGQHGTQRFSSVSLMAAFLTTCWGPRFKSGRTETATANDNTSGNNPHLAHFKSKLLSKLNLYTRACIASCSCLVIHLRCPGFRHFGDLHV